ncbi:MAG: RidA family protein [Bryobacteraceae bacterium]
MLIENPRGGFAFLRGIAPYSAGAVAMAGFDVEHATFAGTLPLKDGFPAIENHLKAIGRPRQALCGIELRSPKPFTFQGFSDFNAGYVGVLKGWDILLEGGVNPVARTNVAPEVHPPSAPGMYGFSYTVPSKHPGKTFVVAGAGELPEGSLDPHDVVRRGETSPEALAEKIRFVMGLMEGRLKGLGVSWNDVTVSEVYTVHNIQPWLASHVLKPMGDASRRGFVWHFSRPPIVSIEYEMDVRGCRHERVLS